MRDHLLGFPPVLLALDERPSCDAIDASLVNDLIGWALGAPERIFSDGDASRYSQHGMRLREQLRESIEFECVDWTFAGTHLYGIDKQPDTTGPDAEGWIAWDPHAGITKAPKRATYAKQRGGDVRKAHEIGTWGEFRSDKFEVIAYRTTPLTAAKK